MIQLKHCQVWREGEATITRFPDGAICRAVNPGDERQLQIMTWVGEPDFHTYNFRHELTHSFLAEVMWDAPSYVVRGAALGKTLSLVGGLFEERWCYHWLKFANAQGPDLEPEWYTWLSLWQKYWSQPHGPG